MSWLLADARIPGRRMPVDLLVSAEGLRLLEPGEHTSTDVQRWALDGRVVLPGLVELHAHIDKTYSDSSNPLGTLVGAIDRMAAQEAARTLQEIEARAERALRAAIAHGVTRMRSHLDFGRPRDLDVLEVMVGLRRRYAGSIDLQFVPMVHELARPERRALLEEGVRLGIDRIGGAPSLSADPAAGVNEVLAAAERLGLGIDLHVDEHDRDHSPSLAALLEHLERRGFPGQVTASHCCSLAFMPPAERDLLLQRMAACGVALVTLPACNLVLMGRDCWPVPRGTAPIAAARRAGVLVGVGADNVQDPFNPFGDYDPLQSARLGALVGHLGTDGELESALELVTVDAARIFGGAPARIDDGLPADLVVTDCREVAEAIAHPPARLATFKGGELVVRTRIEQAWCA
jgi:cytosine deaminase